MKRLDPQHLDANVFQPNPETAGVPLSEGSLQSGKNKKRTPSTSCIKSPKSRQMSIRKSRSKPAIRKFHDELESCHPALANFPSPSPSFSTDASCNKENVLPNSQRSLSYITVLKYDWLKEEQKPVALTLSDQCAGHLAAPCNPNPYQHHQVPATLEIRTPQPQTPICLGNLKLLSNASGEEPYLEAYAPTQDIGKEGYSHLCVRINSQNTSPIYFSSRTRLLKPTLEVSSFRDKHVLPPPPAPSYHPYLPHEHQTKIACHCYAGLCLDAHQCPDVPPIRMRASGPAIYTEFQRVLLKSARSFGRSPVDREITPIYAPEKSDTAEVNCQKSQSSPDLQFSEHSSYPIWGTSTDDPSFLHVLPQLFEPNHASMHQEAADSFRPSIYESSQDMHTTAATPERGVLEFELSTPILQTRPLSLPPFSYQNSSSLYSYDGR
ncbi:hypothetical protein FIBSPDRAFT_935034 [Athelia psychrophila]|uniref:Uncharacterized protein n=1 Tax=Athelia psychrophila TaxID=1759441 RepID=A0A166EHB5_9AGAM|nr:hypothetical protein FIBSPDRAFT_935034 [Fibularhizoctonia sp. CBS 109695]